MDIPTESDLPAVVYNSTDNQYLVVWEGDDDSLASEEFEISRQFFQHVSSDEVRYFRDGSQVLPLLV